MTSTDRARRHLLQMSVVMLLAFWIMSGSESVQALEECDYDTVCEPSLGENCEFCSDCDCECGDNYCSPDAPFDETCFTCPEDCEQDCECGDSYCSYPAEGGNQGWPTCAMSGNPECETCTVDCWDCQVPWSCDTGVCEDGVCVECEDEYDCVEFGSSCGIGFAECVAGTCECYI
jgi:hypothetical protein